MDITIAERHKRSGLCYVSTDEGWEVPVIDITNPAFSRLESPEEIKAISEMSLKELKKSVNFPAFIRRWISRQAVLTRDAYKPYLTGVTCYLMKLGPSNLGEWAKRMDRKVATMVGPLSMRVRVHQVANLMAEHLSPLLAARPQVPVHIVNIAGGAAIDVINGLILLNRRPEDLLKGRRIIIYVLDQDESGPHFGMRALSALQAAGGALEGVDAAIMHLPYDWNDTTALYGLLQQIKVHEGIVAVSTEGGLFEYGSDAAITANLEVLREFTPPGTVIIGSVQRDESTNDPSVLIMSRWATLPVRMLGAEAFGKLAQEAGWDMAAVVEGNPLSQIVVLRKKA